MKQIDYLKLVFTFLVLAAPNSYASVDDAKERGEKITREFMQHLEAGDTDPALQLLDKRLWQEVNAVTEATPDGMFGMLLTIFPEDTPKSLDLIQSRVDEVKGGYVAYTIWEYSWADVFVFGKFTTLVLDDSSKIINFKVLQQDRSVADMSFPGFEKAATKHYLATAAFVGSLSLMIATFVIAIRTPIKRRKWLWCLLPLAGIGRVLFDWNFATFSAYWFSVQLIGAGFFSPGLGESYYLKFTVPVGAVVFLAYRKKLIRASKVPDAPNGSDSHLDRGEA